MFNMHIACDMAHVKWVLQLLLNMLQHVLGNNLQCCGVFLLTTCLTQELNWRLLSKTCCSMFRRSQSTDLTCGALQAVHILNICKTFHGIYVSLNFLFKLFSSTLTLLNFISFNCIVSVIFTCQMMSNLLKYPILS